MKPVMFTLKAGLSSEQQDAVFQRAAALPWVQKPGPVNPGVRSPEMRRFAKLYVSDDNKVADVVARLNALPEVEAAEQPAARQLVQPVKPSTAGSF